MSVGFLTISVKATIRDKLANMKMEGESLGDVIQRLINFWEQHHPQPPSPQQPTQPQDLKTLQ